MRPVVTVSVRLIALIVATSAVTVASAQTPRAPARVEQCALCHRGIEDAHPKKTLACTTCHRGDAGASEKQNAHVGMYANPSDLRVVDRTCGTSGCHQSIAQRVKSNIMAHRSGTQSGTLFPNGLRPSKEGERFSLAPEPTLPGLPLPKGHVRPVGALPRLDPLPTFKQSGDVFFDLLRKECASCHLWTQPRGFRGNFRATGCAACHMPYAENGKSQGRDQAMPHDKVGRPITHQLTTKVPVTQCATCHNGASRSAMNFRGMMETPPAGKETFTYDQDLLHGHAYTPQQADVHYERGMTCVDCHTEREMHGDGQIYAKRHYEVEIRCETCHGSPDKLATGVTAQGRKLRNLFLPAGANPTGLVTLLAKSTGRVHAVPQLAGTGKQPAGHDSTHLQKTECFTCHTAWVPTCYGCHIRMDYTAYAKPLDIALDAVSNQYSKQGWFKLSAGVRFADPEPVLGLNWRGKVVPFVPRAQPLFTYVNPAGQTEYDYKKLGFAHNPIVPHTVVRASRTCESCHANTRALGLGQFTSQQHPRLELFRLPHDFQWDRIVDEDGRTVQVTTVDGARPLNRAEMERMRSAPYKLGGSGR